VACGSCRGCGGGAGGLAVGDGVHACCLLGGGGEGHTWQRCQRRRAVCGRHGPFMAPLHAPHKFSGASRYIYIYGRARQFEQGIAPEWLLAVSWRSCQR
jgi:hypothetical protein